MANNNNTKNLNVPNLRFPEFTEEWKENTVDKIAPLQRGFDLPSQDIRNGYFPIVYSNGILRKHNDYKCKAPGLITGRSGTIGKFTFVEEGYYWPHNTALWVTNFCGNNPKFIYYLYQSISIEQFATGSGVPTLNRNDVHSHKCSVPTTVLEQSKISTFLSLLDQRIEIQGKIIEKYESLIKGLDEKLLTSEKEYITYRLSDICEIRSGYSGTQMTGTEGLMVSRIETISKHCINLNKVGYVKPFNSSADFKLHVGDILFSNINSVQYIGNTAFVDREYDLYHGMNLLRLIPNKIVEPFYVFLLLNTAKYKSYFQSICNKAISQASINQTELSKTVIHIPDLLYQKQICQVYNSLYNKKNVENSYLQALKQQKSYLLRQMFI